jgi:hypothetical protein
MKWLIPLALFAFVSCKKTSSPSSTDTHTILPVLEAATVANGTANSIDLYARISDYGSSSIVEAGFVLDTNHLPTVDINLIRITTEADADGTISGSVTQLLSGRTYYARAYAKNGHGIAYSEQVSFSTLDSVSEKTFDGNVVLTSQQQVDSFAAEHYTHINGYLMISGTVTDLTPLSDLVEVKKELRIWFTTDLLSLNGLQNLRAVNTYRMPDGISIHLNDVLQNLNGLEGITTVYGSVGLMKNYGLTSLEGFNNLKSVTSGGVTIEDCDKITDLQGLNNLESADGITIWSNDLLTSIAALRKLSSAKSLNILQNTSLTQVLGLESLRTLKFLALFHNYNLSDVSGLRSLESIERVQIDSNKLTSLAGFENVTAMQILDVTNSSELADISALSALRNINYIGFSKTALKDLKGLEGIANAYSVGVTDNNNLESLEGLNNIKRLESGLAVANNPKLTDIGALSNATSIEFRLYFAQNTSLSDFCPLKSALTSTYTAELITENNAANPTGEEVLESCP